MAIRPVSEWTYTPLKALGLLSIIVLAVGWVWCQWAYRRLLPLAKTLPTGEPVVPFFGHVLNALKANLEGTFILHMMKRAADKGEEAFCIWMGPFPYLVVQKPEDLQIVLSRSSSLHKGFVFSLVEFVIGLGLLTAPGLMFGKEVYRILPADPKVQQQVIKVIMRAVELWSIRFFRPWLFSDRIFKFLYGKDLKEIECMSNFFTQKVFQVLKEIMSKMQNEKSTDNLDRMGQCTLFDSYISLLGAGISFDERDFQNEILTIATAGTNTTALSLSSLMLALAWHPDIQERLHREIVFVMGDDLKREVTTEDLNNMPYLDQVLKESLRRYPIHVLNQRKTTEDLQLSFGVIPAGSNIVLGMLGVHMNPKIYPNPYKFDPDRFSAENISKRHKFSLLAFSGGPRNCIGMAFAKLTIKIAMVHVIRRYTLHTNADMNLESYKFVLEAHREGGYPIWIEERSY